MDKVENVINELRTQINSCRKGMYYIKDTYDPLDDAEKSTEQIYAEGMKAGIYDGLEMALGLLELIEEKHLGE